MCARVCVCVCVWQNTCASLLSGCPRGCGACVRVCIVHVCVPEHVCKSTVWLSKGVWSLCVYVHVCMCAVHVCMCVMCVCMCVMCVYI